ncbi:tRNA (cytidine(34)-2'-O)-methyltransferase [Zavarzinia compransoris]|uniref:tRNA (cytidine(34)-2'-O)-methyltransferase n=1 Tax=Zavarzinia compransoris TaxID=1264899 RepID=A0A317EBU5_9PROT|nr:tRNA (cytidine(34)-2'-O)-methyltransferase [Zavarzinia compransoris]PWR23764.1 tRNA methyltransferase [Zavarzinia compransoris]TDP47993.1 tRNA (cytidine/uridine-2'-O-)-methyltransferase [Zavarzinia compransoris]
MRLALYCPDIPQNAGTMIRLGACLGVGVDVIEPCGFTFSDASLRRAGMDYLARAAIRRHLDFAAFDQFRMAEGRRLIALTTRGAGVPHDFAFRPDDILLVGRESAGLPDEVHALADARLRIPMVAGARSLNVAVSAAMVLAEALRQTRQFPSDRSE